MAQVFPKTRPGAYEIPSWAIAQAVALAVARTAASSAEKKK